jgi:hypothetical protein
LQTKFNNTFLKIVKKEKQKTSGQVLSEAQWFVSGHESGNFTVHSRWIQACCLMEHSPYVGPELKSGAELDRGHSRALSPGLD